MRNGKVSPGRWGVRFAAVLAALAVALGACLPALTFVLMDRGGQGAYTRSIPEMSLSLGQMTYLERLQVVATQRTESQVGSQLTDHDSTWAEQTARQSIAWYAAEGMSPWEPDAELLSIEPILIVSDAGSLVVWRVYFFWAEDAFDMCFLIDDETGFPLYVWLYDTSTAEQPDFVGVRLWELSNLYVCQIDELLQGVGEHPLADADWDGSDKEVVCYTSLQSVYHDDSVLGVLFTGDRRGWVIWPSIVYPNKVLADPTASPEVNPGAGAGAAAGG